MLEKAKKFYEEHKKVVLIVGGMVVVTTIGVLLSRKVKLPKSKKISLSAGKNSTIEEVFLEGIGAIYKDGYECPFATKDVAVKFMEEVGNCYQLQLFDYQGPEQLAMIWISKEAV